MSKRTDKDDQPAEYTITQIAQLLGVTRGAVLGLRNRGHFPNVRQDTRFGPRSPLYVPKSDLDAYLLKRKRRQPAKG